MLGRPRRPDVDAAREFYAAILGWNYSAAATEHGATVLSGPLDTHYGRMAVITDSQGATFAIMGAVSPN
ncbi:MAG TPA: hypothetical protein VGO16_19885 [Pseudonocardiaceae bacterium]|jgi:predicted enzyme related to lactoylglutathione lyase|nr:hypothetical protein [Pseudonocardiaceae bacterium]